MASGATAAGGARTLAAIETLRATLAVGHRDEHRRVSPSPPALAEAPVQLSFGELENDG